MIPSPQFAAHSSTITRSQLSVYTIRQLCDRPLPGRCLVYAPSLQVLFRQRRSHACGAEPSIDTRGSLAACAPSHKRSERDFSGRCRSGYYCGGCCRCRPLEAQVRQVQESIQQEELSGPSWRELRDRHSASLAQKLFCFCVLKDIQ